MEEDLVGRIEQMKLSPRRALYPLFEAISNSLHGIANLERGEITVHVVREQSQSALDQDYEDYATIVEISITDNGVGFDDENMRSFKLAYTRHKKPLGGKGVAGSLG